jgi:hypothetical protein
VPADPLARVVALLARAGDAASSEEEARTAAVTAARLIREHRFRVVAADGRAAGESPPIVTPERVDRAMDIVEDLADLFKGASDALKPRRRRRIRQPRA